MEIQIQIQPQAQNSVYLLFGYLPLMIISCPYQLAPMIHNIVSLGCRREKEKERYNPKLI